ncbi:MAG TPA: FkbM family methyltransferase [Patescibacteria group bacterium]|nr:FkbM family methyltransferase [Patescibacteria group bacterium]
MTTAAEAGARDELMKELDSMLAESPEDDRDREQRIRVELETQPDLPIVLFGAGGLGRRTLSLLRADGRDAAAFIDNDPARWGSDVEGIPVLSPDDAATQFAADGLAVVTIWRAEGGHDFLQTRDGLRQAGWRRVESFIPLFWSLGAGALPYITIDTPSKVLAARDSVLAAAGLWSDERSLREYVAQVRWRLTGDFASLTPAEPDQYFAEGLVKVGPDEVFVDCGAFTGDTMLDVANRVDSWRAYHAFEPDPASYDALQAAVSTLPGSMAERVHLHKAATSDRGGTAHFSATGLGSASLSSSGTFEVALAAIDDVVTSPPPTFIKMDIEGAESAALAGAARGIRDGQPILAIAAYHKQADLWELPSQVRAMMPAYRLYLRPHVAEGFDTVLYAMTADRAPAV